MTKFLTVLLLTSILFASCLHTDKQKTSSAGDTTAVAIKKNNADTLKPAGYFKFEGDSVIIPHFEIALNLSPKAAEKITKARETIIVSVFFNGTPKDSSASKLEEDGSFYVSHAEKEIAYGQVARFDSIKFPRKIYDQLADKDIDMTVNVYSGRKSTRDNLLNCELLADKISNTANKRFIIKGRLIYGDD